MITFTIRRQISEAYQVEIWIDKDESPYKLLDLKDFLTKNLGATRI